MRYGLALSGKPYTSKGECRTQKWYCAQALVVRLIELGNKVTASSGLVQELSGQASKQAALSLS
mgnify:FL=1